MEREFVPLQFVNKYLKNLSLDSQQTFLSPSALFLIHLGWIVIAFFY